MTRVSLILAATASALGGSLVLISLAPIVGLWGSPLLTLACFLWGVGCGVFWGRRYRSLLKPSELPAKQTKRTFPIEFEIGLETEGDRVSVSLCKRVRGQNAEPTREDFEQLSRFLGEAAGDFDNAILVLDEEPER